MDEGGTGQNYNGANCRPDVSIKYGSPLCFTEMNITHIIHTNDKLCLGGVLALSFASFIYVFLRSAGGCPGGVWLEVGPWRYFPTSQERNAAVSFPRLRNSDLHHDLRHSLYVCLVQVENSP